LFKEETGTTIRKYQQELRLKRARELLLTTHMSIKEIIVAVGAGDKAILSESLRKPTVYR